MARTIGDAFGGQVTTLEEQRAIWAMMRPSIGLFFSNTRPSCAATYLPLMNARPSGRSGVASRSHSLRLRTARLVMASAWT